MTPRPTILLVEDNHDHLRLTKKILERSGLKADVLVARDGKEALSLLQGLEEGQVPHLVLLDLNMPKVSGREVLRTMKADPRLANVPVVVISSSNREEDATLAHALGASGFVSKAGGFEQLTKDLGTLRRYLPSEQSSGR
jgi:two-component system response regulator